MEQTQQEVKHTPAPWRIDEQDEATWRILGPNLGRYDNEIAELAYTGGNAEANARLIAAAPALLKALNLLYGLITAGDLIEARGIRWWTRDSEMASIRAAIALAEGRQP